MKIRQVLWVTNIPSPYRTEFFNMLGKKCQLTVVFEREKSVERHVAWVGRAARYYRSIVLRGIYTDVDKALCWGVVKVLHEFRNKIIVISNYSTPTGMLAIGYLKLMKIPYIFEGDGGFIANESMVKKWVKSKLISGARAYFSTSDSFDKYLIYYGAAANKIFRYPFSSIRLSQIRDMPSTRQKKEERRRENDINTEKVILCIGQFVPRKGIDILLMSAIHVKSNATLIIIGGEPTDSYLQLVNEHRLNHVRFVDFMDKSDMSAYFSLADIFVLPTREDIWGLVINEAMAEGLPIITTDKCIAGLELVEDNVNGFIIPINEPRLLAEKIDYILTDPKKNESFGQASLHKVKCYTIEEMVARHISLFEYLF